MVVALLLIPAVAQLIKDVLHEQELRFGRGRPVWRDNLDEERDEQDKNV